MYNDCVERLTKTDERYRMAYNMKKLFAGLLCVLLAVCITGCDKNIELAPEEIVDKLKQNVSLGELTEISGDKLSSYFSFSDKEVSRFSVIMGGSGETADIIAAFEYKDNAQRAKVIDGVTQYLTYASGSFKKTMENEHKKLQNRVLVELSDTIVLVVCSDYTGASQLLTDLGAKPLT